MLIVLRVTSGVLFNSVSIEVDVPVIVTVLRPLHVVILDARRTPCDALSRWSAHCQLECDASGGAAVTIVLVIRLAPDEQVHTTAANVLARLTGYWVP